MLNVWDGVKWQIFSPDDTLNTDNLLIWDDSNVSQLDVIGGKNSKVHFATIVQEVSLKEYTKKHYDNYGFLNVSIHNLTLEDQVMFKTILLIPIRALIVVFLRVFIGLKTAGTFMPILISVALVTT